MVCHKVRERICHSRWRTWTRSNSRTCSSGYPHQLVLHTHLSPDNTPRKINSGSIFSSEGNQTKPKHKNTSERWVNCHSPGQSLSLLSSSHWLTWPRKSGVITWLTIKATSNPEFSKCGARAQAVTSILEKAEWHRVVIWRSKKCPWASLWPLQEMH